MYVHKHLSYKAYRSQYTASGSIFFSFTVVYTVQSPVLCKGYHLDIKDLLKVLEAENDVLWYVLSLWVEKVLKWVVEFWMSTADKKDAD